MLRLRSKETRMASKDHLNKRQRNKKPIPIKFRELMKREISWNKIEKNNVVFIDDQSDKNIYIKPVSHTEELFLKNHVDLHYHLESDMTKKS